MYLAAVRIIGVHVIARCPQGESRSSKTTKGFFCSRPRKAIFLAYWFSIDFRKAIDLLELIALLLQLFNFGESIRQWVRALFYTDIESAALNNGCSANWFKLSRGVKQGCSLSPYLFIWSIYPLIWF